MGRGCWDKPGTGDCKWEGNVGTNQGLKTVNGRGMLGHPRDCKWEGGQPRDCKWKWGQPRNSSQSEEVWFLKRAP